VDAEPAAKRFFISGMVQGVGYRCFARATAHRLGLSGYVKNLGDGRVEAYAIGPAQGLAAFRADLQRGPQGATVSRVVEEEAPRDERFARGFSIEFE